LIQNSASRLIEAFVDQVDGSLNKISQAGINIIHFQLTANPKYYQLIPNAMSDSPFFKNCAYETQIETTLTVLGLMSYLGSGRTDIVNLI
jgi:hypothetical protein